MYKALGTVQYPASNMLPLPVPVGDRILNSIVPGGTLSLCRASGDDEGKEVNGPSSEKPAEVQFNGKKFHRASNLRGLAAGTHAAAEVLLRRARGEVGILYPLCSLFPP